MYCKSLETMCHLHSIIVCNILNFIFSLQGTNTLLNTDYQKCLAVHHSTKQLLLLHCDPINTYQQWIFREIVPKW